MNFDNFHKQTSEAFSCKMKGLIKWSNFCDDIWTLMLRDVLFHKVNFTDKSRDFTVQNLKMVLFDTKRYEEKNIFDDEGRLCLEGIQKKLDYVESLEGTNNPLILSCEDDYTENIGVGFFSYSKTKSTKSDILIDKLFLLTGDGSKLLVNCSLKTWFRRS